MCINLYIFLLSLFQIGAPESLLCSYRISLLCSSEDLLVCTRAHSSLQKAEMRAVPLPKRAEQAVHQMLAAITYPPRGKRNQFTCSPAIASSSQTMINAGNLARPFETRGEGHRGTFVLPESSSRHIIQIWRGGRDTDIRRSIDMSKIIAKVLGKPFPLAGNSRFNKRMTKIFS